LAGSVDYFADMLYDGGAWLDQARPALTGLDSFGFGVMESWSVEKKL